MYTIKSYKRFLNELRQSSTDTLDTPDKRIAAAEKSIADETKRNNPSPEKKYRSHDDVFGIEQWNGVHMFSPKEEVEEDDYRHRGDVGRREIENIDNPTAKDLKKFRSKPDPTPPPHHVDDSYGHPGVNTYPRPLSFTPPKQRAAQPSKPVPLSWDPVAQVSKMAKEMAKDKPTGRQLPEVLPEVDPAPSTTHPAVKSEPWKRRTQHPNPSPSMEDSIRELSPYLFKNK